MSAENREPNEVSRVISEDKTLLRLENESSLENELTRRFAASDSEKAQAIYRNAPETEQTKILSDDETDEEENAPKHRLYDGRFALGLTVFILFFIFAGTNARQAFLPSWNLPFEITPLGDKLFIYIVEQPAFREKIKEGDELMSFKGQTVTNIHQFNHLWLQIKAGESYTIGIKRDGQISEFEFIAEPVSFYGFLHSLITVILFPAVFLVTGLLVFLFKPNDKHAFLLAMMFALFLPPRLLGMMEGLPTGLVALRLVAFISNSIGSAIWLHFFLVFPERSLLLRRFPALERFIYVPSLLFILPGHLLVAAKIVGYDLPINYTVQMILLVVTGTCGMLYYLACVPAFWLNYRQAGEVSRRKLRALLFGLSIGLLFPVVSFLTIIFLWFLNFHGQIQLMERVMVISESFLLLIPPVFAYAIVRHKVIPVSLFIRRGLQYLLTKNALRLLFILCVAGILWNIAANPARPLDEILLRNSAAFYVFVVLAVALALLNRFGLRELIDKRFFREQYDQEKLLHQLINDVKQSDSMPKLSRFVSSRIQAAIHPSNVIFFYEDKNESDHSLVYTTGVDSENLKLAAASPLLRFMERQRGAVDFPSRVTKELPSRERSWLKGIGANLLVPMHGSDGKLAGFLSLGEKLSEIPYTSRDRELLETLAYQIALAQENLSLKDRVRREQQIKTEVLGRFEEGNINLLKECPRCGKCFDRDVINCPEDDSKLNFTLPVERTIENRYRLDRLLGRGGMGAVYEATDLRINRKVAVKVLSDAKFGNRYARRRFELEAQSAGRLHHKNIVTVFDYGTLSTEGAFLVMELVHGESLSDVLKRAGKLDLETIVQWFAQILNGMETAHRAGIIHRDLKPDNIFVVREEMDTRICILDFGLARLNENEMEVSSPSNATMPGMIMGTLGYMSPEQLRGERVDERTDLFAIGVMIYEALYGEKPFRGQTYQELRSAMIQEISFEKDEPINEFFKRSLALNPERRFASANEMKKSLVSLKI